MKIDDLKIGDWVLVNVGDPGMGMKLVQVISFRDHFKVGFNFSFNANDGDYYFNESQNGLGSIRRRVINKLF